MYRKHTESVSLLCEKLETLNAKDEIDIMLGVFNLDAKTHKCFNIFLVSAVISKFYLIIIPI